MEWGASAPWDWVLKAAEEPSQKRPFSSKAVVTYSRSPAVLRASARVQKT
jgi:hypothetical protein